MGKQVKVITSCGEERVYNYDQEVVSAEIVEKKEYPLQKRLNDALEILDNTCPGANCDNCAFSQLQKSCTKVLARRILQKAAGYQS